MNKIRKGEEVICIETDRGNKLTKGKIYIVEDFWSKGFIIKDDQEMRGGWYSRRFGRIRIDKELTIIREEKSG